MLGFMRQFDGNEHNIAPSAREAVAILQQGVRLLFRRWQNSSISVPYGNFNQEMLLLADESMSQELRFTALRRTRRGGRIQSLPALAVEVCRFGPTSVSERDLLSMTTHQYNAQKGNVIRFDGEDVVSRLRLASQLIGDGPSLTTDEQLFAKANSERANSKLAKKHKFNEQPVGPGEVAALVAASMFGEPL